MNPEWKIIFYVKNGEIASESDVSYLAAKVWVETKYKWSGVVLGHCTVYYMDSDDLEVGDVPSSS